MNRGDQAGKNKGLSGKFMQTCAGRLIFSPDKGERLVSCFHASFNPIKPLGLKGELRVLYAP
jgi:hypothetical protein